MSVFLVGLVVVVVDGVAVVIVDGVQASVVVVISRMMSQISG